MLRGSVNLSGEDMNQEEVLTRCEALILCKSELFFQTMDGRTLATWYPVGKEAASVCSEHFGIPLCYEDEGPIDNKKVIEASLTRE